MAKNEAKIKFSADCQEFNSQIQKANSTMQQLRAEMKLNEAQMKANGTSVEGLEDKYKILANINPHLVEMKDQLGLQLE